MGARSRKASLAPDDPDNPAAASSSSHTPGDISPVSPSGFRSPSPVELHSIQSHDSLKHETPEDYLDFGSRHGPFHSQSTNSLNTTFTDGAPSSFSPGGPMSPTSPFFTPDSGTAPSPFVPQGATRPILPASSSANSQRPRSQTFPLLDQYVSNPGDSVTPKFSNATLDSPMEERPDPMDSLDETMELHRHDRPPTMTPSETMRPPPLPSHIQPEGTRRDSTPATPASIQQATTPEEARKALQVVLTFFEQQPNGFLDFNESMTIGRLMEKLKLQGSGR